MAISLSDFTQHCLPLPHLHPKPSHFLCDASKSSSHSTQSNLSLKPSSSKTPSHKPNPSKDTARFKKLLRESLVESIGSQRHSLDVQLCAKLIICLCSSGELDQAARFISFLESQSHSKRAKTVVYNGLITGLCRNNQTIHALETLGRMRANGLQPNKDTCNILVNGLCSRGLLDLAFEMVEHFKTFYEVHPDLVAYNQLLERIIVGKGVKEQMKLLDEMESDGLFPDETTYNSVVRAICKTGNVDEIQAILDGIPASGFKLDAAAYCASIKVLLENDHFGKVDKVIDEMLVKASNAQLEAVINMLCEEGLVDKARALIERLVKNRRRNLKFFNPVIHTFIKEGHPNKALHFINFLISIYDFSDISVYNPILSGLCIHGHVPHALVVLDKLEKMGCFPNSITYASLIKGLWKSGDHVGSVKVVSQLWERGLSPNTVTYGALVWCLCADGMVDEAMEVKKIMAENGFRITKRIYNMLLLGFCKVGRVNEAIDLLEEMLENDCEVNCTSIGIILEGLVHIGYQSEARKIVKELVLRSFSR